MRVFVTGAAGFIGYHLSDLLLKNGHSVHGFDSMNDYYDVTLKESRHSLLQAQKGYSATIGKIEDEDTLFAAFTAFQPDVVVHLAAQAGVRYSLENPRAYLNSNIVGTFNVMEAARDGNVRHLLMASTSSVYGANTKMPFKETDKTDTQLTFYAATKKANESMGHTYAHLWKIPTTMFRFFTVYGPWGRPDMAPHKFIKGISEGRTIDIYNHGEMFRDFTYVTDLVRAIDLLIDRPPQMGHPQNEPGVDDSLSPVAPFRVVNIGNSEKVHLLEFIEAIEDALETKAVRNYMEMQKGDVPATWADASLLMSLTGYAPQTSVREGVKRMVEWYRDYY